MDTRPSSEYFEIRRPSSEKQVPQGTVLLHVFGTPSAVRACALLRLYRQHYGTTLSLKAIVLDAAPSPLLHGPKDLLKQASRLKRKPLRSHVASSLQGVFAFILQTATSLIAMLFTMLPSLVGREVNEEAKVRQDLNDPKLVPRNARRCYMFPGKNMLFSWKEGVARKGDNRGEDIRKEWTVRREKVGREGWGGDEERFWEGIEALWEGRDAD
ncbi:MAG: hypothetical protein M1820_004007 [Bogoriella megaspora]|nr:MAG: hypothetical protein M1820_004007 [Bogoriella megaspora]